MAERGVEGCRLEAHHLKRTFHNRGFDEWSCWMCHDSWKTCEQCCFGFPVEQGVWMKDWDASLPNAANAARQTAEQPLVRNVLEALRSDSVPQSLAISEEAMANLLDIAILIGDREAAVRCAEQSRLRPLRRWSWKGIFHLYRWAFGGVTAARDNIWLYSYVYRLELGDRGMLLAALSAGVELQGLLGPVHQVPFRVAVALTGTPWTDFADLLPPPDTPWVPPEKNGLGEFFLKYIGSGKVYLRKDLLEIAQRVQVPLAALNVSCSDLDYLNLFCPSLSLLDCAILLGQSDCAALLARAGAEVSGYGSDLLLKDGALDAEPARRPAAMAAAHSALSKVWKSEIAAKGIAIYQLTKKLLKGRPFPACLVDEVVAFSMNAPKIIERLDLREEASAWCKSILLPTSKVVREAPLQALPQGHSVGEEVDAEDLQEPRTTSPSQQDQQDALEAEEAVDDKATDDLMQAMRASRNDVPPLNMHGVRLYRLKGFSNAKHITDLLFDPHGPLKALHHRIQEAGCSVDPEGNPVKILFVPCAEEQLLELHQLAADGFELRRDAHILALEQDAELIDGALRNFPRKDRPKLKKVGPQQEDVGAQQASEVDLRDDDDAEGPMIVTETGFGLRTDSDVGYPSYQ
ncbi:Uncharacterized protein SCF082_LOCUS38518 [Durusdinium trenchii]